MKIVAFVKLLAEAAGQIPEKNLPGSVARFDGISDDGRCSGLQCEFRVTPEGDVLPAKADGIPVLVNIKRGVSASWEQAGRPTREHASARRSASRPHT